MLLQNSELVTMEGKGIILLQGRSHQEIPAFGISSRSYSPRTKRHNKNTNHFDTSNFGKFGKVHLTLLQFMDTLMYIHISGLGLLALAHKEENTHTGVRFEHNFGSNLTQCVSDIWSTIHPYDGWVCSIEVYASR
jgi:hypothetical protein